MPLSSASTDADVWAAYDDNAAFDEAGTGSVAMAQAFVTACRILLRRTPQSVTEDGVSHAWDHSVIAAELERARTWLAHRQASGSVRHLDFSGLRD